MARETQTLKELAKAAREFDHNGNRGSEAEAGLARWLNARFAPSFAVSAGEIIDSFDTNASLDSRQQDLVLHANDADANRFLLPSGKRLLPIESVVAPIEIKLTLNSAKFREADAKATEVARLRLRPGPGADINVSDDFINARLRSLSSEQHNNGISISDSAFVYAPVVFALFAFESQIKDSVAISRWLDEAETISLVCCLDTGCVYNDKLRQVHEFTQSEEALTHFVERLVLSTKRYVAHLKHFEPDYSAYAPHTLDFVQRRRSQGGGETCPETR